MTDKDLTIRQQSIALSPQDIVANASNQARVLMDIVEQTKCFQVISGKKYLQVEAWETIGSFNHVHAVTEWVNPIMRVNEIVGYDAKVNLLNTDGDIVGSAIMPCYFTENACKGKEGDAKDKAAKSAAQTFATSKAYRMNYSYIAILAGYEPTPLEEMGDTEHTQAKPIEHWCEKHKTKFFMAGKMKSYAHPITGTKDWCYEQKKETQPVADEDIEKTKDELWGEKSKTNEAVVVSKPAQAVTGSQIKPVVDTAKGKAPEGEKKSVADELSWEWVLEKLQGLLKAKKEGWTSEKGIIQKLVDIGATENSGIQVAYNSLNDDGKRKFIELIKKEE